MKADFLYFGAVYPVSRSKLYQGAGYDAVIKSAARPECHQTIQTGHYGDTSDRGSVQGEYLNNQKVFFHESNFKRRLTHQEINEAWNYKKTIHGGRSYEFYNPEVPQPV